MKTIVQIIVLVLGFTALGLISVGLTIFAFSYIDRGTQIRRNTELCSQERQVPLVTVTGHSSTVIATKDELVLVEGEKK